VPILTRKPTDYAQGNDHAVRVDDKVNNTLNNPLDAEIIDTKVGPMFGNPISYVVNKQVQSLSMFQLMIKRLFKQFLSIVTLGIAETAEAVMILTL